MPGVLRSLVGYCGGEKPDPTYRSVCGGDGHTEAMLLEYDPSQITFEQILNEFYDQHVPFRPTKKQYRSAIWPQNDEQLRIAERVKVEREQAGGRTLFTDIEEPTKWFDAEEYHQKYVEKSRNRW
mmetsp:Transcript_101/g.201  ORF Transcript_101/g.201 Transcript_101/m.201 type:complete len:125 (+) Transcript_101:264-638(+)